MLRSLFSGVSGMKNNQTKMDVIANNIANVNTTAFKSSRVRFQDIFSQTLREASSPAANGSMGGVNPRQVGLGMQVAGIDTLTEQGSLQPTARPLDFAIEGEGYFILQDGSRSLYTRDGSFNFSFEVNASGVPTGNLNIVNSDGYKLMGGTNGTEVIQIPEKKGGAGIESISVSQDGTIIVLYEDNSTEIRQIALASFINPGGLTKIGGNNYIESANSGTASKGPANANGRGVIRQSTLEMSNVDLADQFTEMIITSRAYQANSRSITTSDEMLQELLNLKR